MKFKAKRLLIGVLVASLAIANIASCGKKDEIVDNGVSADIDLGTVVSSVDPSEAKKNVYYAEEVNYTDIKGEYIIANHAYGIVNGLYTVISTVNDSNDNNLAKLGVTMFKESADIDKAFYLSVPSEELLVPQEIAELVEDNYNTNIINNGSEYIKENYQCSVGYSNVRIMDDGSFRGVIEYYYSFYSSAYDKSLYSTESYACKWNSDGSLSWYKRIRDKAVSDVLTVINSVAVDEYYLVISSLNNTDTEVKVYGNNGDIVYNQKIAGTDNLLNIKDVLPDKNGRQVAFYKDSEGYQRASCFDITKAELTGDIILPDYLMLYGYQSISKGFDSDYVFSDLLGVYSANFDSTDITIYMDYSNSDFAGDCVSHIGIISNNKFWGVYSNLQNYSDCIAMFKAADGASIADRAIVILGSYRLPANIRSQILKYNSENDVYRVIVKEYSYMDTVDNPINGCEALEQDIIAGNGPDLTMINPGIINAYSLVDEGKLLPWSYLVNSDTEFSGSDYIESVMDAYAINGLDYIMIYDFVYRSFIGSNSIVGTGTSWSVKDFKKAVAKAPSEDAVMYMYISQDDFLEKLIRFNASEYIDFENKKCTFDSNDFMDMLKYGLDVPKDVNEELSVYSYPGQSYRNGDILLMEANVVKADAFWNSSFRYFDGKASVIGFPDSKESSSIVEFVDLPIMIMAEKNVGGAWDFAKTFYSFDYQRMIVNAIPVSYTAFDTWGNNALANQNYYGVNELGEAYSYQATYYYDGQEYNIPDINADNISAIKTLILSADKAAFYDVNVKAIITEEANNFFAGIQTAKQAAANINSRVSEYLFN